MCLEGYFLLESKCLTNCRKQGMILNFKDSTCIDVCPTTFYSFFDTQIEESYCQKCGDNCDFCLDSNVCYTCSENFFIYQNQCLNNCAANHSFLEVEKRCSICPDGQYEIEYSNNSYKCEVCDPKCHICWRRKENCLSCNEGYFI